MQFLTGSVWLYILTETLTENFLLTLLSLKSIITSSDQLLQLLLLLTYLYPQVTSDPLIARLSVTVKKSFNMPAFINHSNVFPLGAWNALSVYMSASLTRCILTLIVRPVFYSLVIALWLYVFAPPELCFVRNRKCCRIKGAQQRWVWFGTLLMWFCLFHKVSKLCFLSFLKVYDLMFVCVNLYACDNFFVLDLMYVCVCVCVMRKTTLNLLIS